MSGVVVIGAGGHSRSVLANLQQNKIAVKAIYDHGFKEEEKICGVMLVGKPDSILPDEQVVLAVGNNSDRATLFEKFNKQIFESPIVHPTASYEQFVKFGRANLIFANCYLNNEVSIENNNLINTGAILEHEVKIGSHNHVSVGAVLLGRAKIGSHCFIGARAIVRDGVTICDNVTVGAGSFVAENITEPGTYVGSPARKVR